MKEAGSNLLLVTMLDEVAWLLNLRGSDVPCNPVFLSYVTVPLEGPARLYVDPAKVPEEVKVHLNESDVELVPYGRMLPDLEAAVGSGSKVMLDPSKVSYALYHAAINKGWFNFIFHPSDLSSCYPSPCYPSPSPCCCGVSLTFVFPLKRLQPRKRVVGRRGRGRRRLQRRVMDLIPPSALLPSQWSRAHHQSWQPRYYILNICAPPSSRTSLQSSPFVSSHRPSPPPLPPSPLRPSRMTLSWPG